MSINEFHDRRRSERRGNRIWTQDVWAQCGSATEKQSSLQSSHHYRSHDTTVGFRCAAFLNLAAPEDVKLVSTESSSGTQTLAIEFAQIPLSVSFMWCRHVVSEIGDPLLQSSGSVACRIISNSSRADRSCAGQRVRRWPPLWPLLRQQQLR